MSDVDAVKNGIKDIQATSNAAKSNELDSAKPWYKSRGLIGVILALPAIAKIVLNALGYEAFTPVVDQVVDIISAIAGSVGLRLAWVGRATATQKIRGYTK